MSIRVVVAPCFRRLSRLALVLGLAICAFRTVLIAAEPEFVGILALAVEEDVANKIGLSPEQRDQLLDFVDERETQVIDLALEIRDLSASERAERLAPFRTDTERQGLRLLNVKQQAALQAVRIRRAGMQTLAERTVSTELKLSPEQMTGVKRLIGERDAAMNDADRRTSTRLRENYERQLKELLTQDQFDNWERMTVADAQQSEIPGGDGALSESSELTEGAPLGIPPGKSAGDGQLIFNFRFAPWSDVLDWFASQADLSLVMDAPLKGTFNYADTKSYTPAEAIDLLNSVLLTKGFTLVRRGRMLMLVNIEDGIPPNLVTQIPLDELDQRGEYELVRCMFPLKRISAEQAQKEISELVGPQGTIVVLPTAHQILVTETAGRLRTIRQVLVASEREDENSTGNAMLFTLTHVKAPDVLTPWRQLMGLGEEETAMADGSLRIAAGPSGKRLLVTGRTDQVRQFNDLVKLLDVPLSGGLGSALGALQLEVYSVTDADPISVLEVMQTLFAGLDNVRLASDPKTGDLVALARPAEHATIQATLDQMQRDRRELEVIQLNIVDPQLAVMAIDKLFGSAAGDGAVIPNGPRVDAEPTTRSLLIRGSKGQVAEIRELLQKMGESGVTNDLTLTNGRGNVRLLPITGSRARRVLEQMNTIWPSVRKNRIRTVTPSSSIRAVRPRRDSTDPPPEDSPDDEKRRGAPETAPFSNSSPQGAGRAARGAVAPDLPMPLGWVSIVSEPPADSDARSPSTNSTGDESETKTGDADIVVTPGQRGILIASDDLEALDEFERLARTLADRLFTGSRELVVFYLKYAKAEVAKELVAQLLGTGGGDEGGGQSLLGSLAGAALGESGGGLVGSLLGLGGGGSSGGTVALTSNITIIADTRLNALFVQATPEELELAEQLLEVIDIDAGPELLQTNPLPETIPLLHTDADEIAEIVQNVYANRISGKGGRAKEPSPEEIIRAMSGQKNRGKSMQDAVEDQIRMTVSVDTRRNALIVRAPQSLLLEVKALVAELDTPVPDELRETVRVVSIRRANPETIRRALAAIAGDNLITSGVPNELGEKASPSAAPDGADPAVTRPGAPSSDQAREQFRQRMQFMQMLQRAGQRGGKDRAGDGKGKPGAARKK